MRALLRWLFAGIGLFLLAGGYLIWNNNRTVPAPDQATLETARDRAVQWLVDHRTQILNTNNPMLWRMIQHAAEVSSDKRLQDLFAQYRHRYLDGHPNNVWHPLFYPRTWLPVNLRDIASLPDYNQYFVYAITCDRDLGKAPEIASQNDAGFCDQHLFRPACATHQMMGMLLLKRSECGDATRRNETIRALQQRVENELIRDPRVVDVYMQRVLMLVQSGAGDAVKAIWLQNLLEAQQEDGGWSGFMPLLPLGGHRYLGISRLLSIEAPKSNFHMTAQGVLLFSLLTHPQARSQEGGPGAG